MGFMAFCAESSETPNNQHAIACLIGVEICEGCIVMRNSNQKADGLWNSVLTVTSGPKLSCYSRSRLGDPGIGMRSTRHHPSHWPISIFGSCQ